MVISVVSTRPAPQAAMSPSATDPVHLDRIHFIGRLPDANGEQQHCHPMRRAIPCDPKKEKIPEKDGKLGHRARMDHGIMRVRDEGLLPSLDTVPWQCGA